MPAPYTGGCQCGSVRYVVTMEPIRLLACHCKECQRQSASAFGMSMLVKKVSLTVTGVAKQLRAWAVQGHRFCERDLRSSAGAHGKASTRFT